MANKTQIFIVGDELGLAEPLLKALTQAGHAVEAFVRPHEATEALVKKKPDYAYVDCMLQGSMNGADFIAHLKKANPQLRTQFVLMSGIFTEKAFVKEAMEKTAALAFIEKKMPFDAAPYLSLVQSQVVGETPSARKNLYQIFAQGKVTAREKERLIASLEEVSGYDLPIILSLLVETKSSGYLNINSKNNEVSGITLSHGEIVGVDVVDRTTFLGEMLIQTGYVRPQDVAEAMGEKSKDRIGMRLIAKNLLSPHAFDLILTDQMNIRLSRMIVDEKLRINFIVSDVQKNGPSIDSEILLLSLHDWVAAKMSVSWLKSLYLMWAANRIELSSTFREDDPAFQMGLVKALPNFILKLREGVTLNQLLTDRIYTETAVYKGLHFLLIRGLVIFGAKAGFRDEDEQIAALQKLSSDMDRRNAFEIASLLGIENMSGENLANLLGPEPLSPSAITLWKGLRARIEAAAVDAQKTDGRLKFAAESEGRETESRLRASQKVEEAKKALGFGQFAKAMTLLNDAQKAQPNTGQLSLLVAWAKIGLITPSRRNELMKEIEFELMQIPPEERYDAHYSLVLGLFQKAKGDLKGAQKHFERAVALNASLMIARRELGSISNPRKKDDILNMDLKTLVGGLFKKR